MTTLYALHREQHIPRTLDEVFAFFADAGNLEAITPPWLNFRIETPRPIELRDGTVIDYCLRWHGVPLRWRSEIAEWTPPDRFVDVQLRGPYSHWRHTHTFEATDQGTLMRDDVEYALPLGSLGRLAHRLLVRRQLETIFDYRCQRVAELLGS